MPLLSKHTCKERNCLTQQKYSRTKCLNWVFWEPEVQIKGLSLCWGCTNSGSWEWEKRKGSREGDNAMSWVYPSVWVQLQSESQRQKRVTHLLIHGLYKKSVKELHLEVAQQEKEGGRNFSSPVTSITHFPLDEIYPTGCCLPLWLLGEWEAGMPALGHGLVSKSRKRGNLVWIESRSRDKQGNWRALKKCLTLCPNIVEYLVASEHLRGSLVPGQGEIFLISLKSHHRKDYVFLKK